MAQDRATVKVRLVSGPRHPVAGWCVIDTPRPLLKAQAEGGNGEPIAEAVVLDMGPAIPGAQPVEFGAGDVVAFNADNTTYVRFGSEMYMPVNLVVAHRTQDAYEK